MPRRDLYHSTVRKALIKDGWLITDDPFVIQYKGLRLYADLGAEKPLAAEKDGQKIVVEIKVFGTPSLINELENAVGQYAVYRTFLKQIYPDHQLFLALPHDIYQDFFQHPAVKIIISDHNIHLIVFDPDKEEIIKWEK